jgi:hypothetical protein
MRVRTMFAAVATAVFAGCGTGYPVYDVPGVSFAAPLSQGLDPVAFLVGCWRGGEPDGPTAEENFSIAGAGTMMGWSRTTRNGRLGSWEFSRIVDDVDDIFLEVWPNGEKSSARFRMTDGVPAARVTFEDPAHDFPRRIRYQLIQDDLLEVRIDDGNGGGLRIGSYVKVSCDAA